MTLLETLKEVSWDWSSMEQSSPQTIASAVLQHLIDEHSEVRGTGRVDKKSQVVSVKTLMKLIEELK
jgi:hypothetical protein